MHGYQTIAKRSYLFFASLCGIGIGYYIFVLVSWGGSLWLDGYALSLRITDRLSAIETTLDIGRLTDRVNDLQRRREDDSDELSETASEVVAERIISAEQRLARARTYILLVALLISSSSGLFITYKMLAIGKNILTTESLLQRRRSPQTRKE